MEPQSYQQQQQQPEENNGPVGVAGSGGASKSNFLCRQSSSRWIPTTDQIRILRDLYYNCGVRSPSAEQIQRISARLRQYGKIEGKNVFYWFQNHKARERQKKRLTVDIAANKYNTGVLSPGVCTPPGVYCVGQVGGNACGGSVLVEKNYMEYSLAGALGGGSMMEGATGWIGVEPASMPPLYYHHQRPAYLYEHQQHQYYQSGIQQRGGGGEEVEGEEAPPVPPHIETLPLFPVHSRPHQDAGEDYEGGGREWVVKAHASLSGHFPATLYLDQPQDPDQLRRREDGGHRRNHRVYDGDSSINIGGASLELSLYSYGSPPHGPN